MFRNQYDQDVTTWSPQGRMHQVEYAMEAVKQGSAAVGLKSDTHVVLATLNRASSELSSHQRKTFKVDDHLGIAMSGIISDGRSLCRYMRNECLNHRYVFEAPLPTARLVRQVADRAQVCTQRSWKRPYGVGLLVAGFDKAGGKLFYCCPSGSYYDYKAMAIGARSQAAKTYLERKFEEFASADLDTLIRHGLQALSASVTDGELTKDNVSVALVGKGTPLTLLEDADLEPHLAALADEVGGDGAGSGGAMEEGGGADGASAPPAAPDGASGAAEAAPAPEDEPPAPMET
ncbi:hypothetical protein WJX81_008485 [Elliptochloris bilobata]|uniref:Proteasome subunit alpha type n=1 Tax=Elliptochloris bilobata TaxID=381761 RepID=A0AAW1SDX1_9CHLO